MHPHSNVVGVHLVFEQTGKVLLGLRSSTSAYAPDTWHLPAGHLEDESATTCAVREAHEELGVSIDEQDLRLIHVVHQRDSENQVPRVQLLFQVLDYAGTPTVREPERCTSWRWWPYGALPTPLVDYAAVALTGIAAGRTYTQMGWAA
ncbi:NUDIX domain-containing protein [Streptomyces sp. TRM66268-LWL]|uniref:NUDIX domain-containing protein n=1 Tax=Streptomyces polyasparticus TaxID=2767826 RepID=A0ABR7SR08_9ACTN|nr:NUDIX domain-containing protein [Streptomyces polyasparticus]MBC9717828.1 NUDIX domain-containing protein [Streptomyces polyasparticus]